ncbi:hypothetical protein BCF53_103185 [Reinekea marinisedimentorum]|uniref:DUF432 domain-containing protein n=1 Tax=Reinekea marinisedimentorum TaxID=230495 RepID=A0A4R3I8Q8_9GAMM|nr:hypothetical protein BCF53_103185 [Reinekea marinisedimentorum]
MHWWGEVSVSLEQKLSWQIGARAIVISRLEGEWVTWNLEAEQENRSPVVMGDWHDPELLDIRKQSRNLQHGTTEHLSVLPALADRSFVTRPATPLKILPGERARLYVSTPLWFQARTLKNDSLILDVPFWRPSDSWFGSSTISGEICYAKYTDARLQLNALERAPYRAITPICVSNQHSEVLVIDRFNVPVPLLGLFSDESHHLWTEVVNIIRGEDDDAELEISKEAPIEAGKSIRVSEPRVLSEKRTFIRRISSLFL